nr:hypothetical protein [Tanacetum cinerariifolium]
DESSDSDDEPEAEDADDEPEAEDADDELEVEDADVELEAEEPDGVPKAVIGAGSQRPFAIRDFPIGVYETGESSTARDPQFVGGLAPWALRLNLEALRRHERIREAESETGMDIDGYTNRFHELALLCPRMVEPEAVKVEQYIRGLTKSIRGDVTSSQPATINDAVRLAYQLAGQLIQDKANKATEGEKRKGESDRGGRGNNRRKHNHRQNQRRGNPGAVTNAAPNNNETCQKCKNKRHA